MNSFATGQSSGDRLAHIISFLKTVPTNGDIAQALVMRFFSSDGARGGALGLFDEAGMLEVAGSFGHDQPPPSTRLHVWDDDPLCMAARERQPCLGTRAGRDADQLWLSMPLLLAARCLGAAIVSINRESRDEVWQDDLLARAAIVADAITIYLSGNPARRNVGTSPVVGGTPRTSASSVGHSNDEDDLLTARQKIILLLLGKGLTNTQVAFQIGYSESTVRHETMTIFRKLGVSGRKEAVTVGRLRGLCDPTASEDPVSEF